MAKQTTPAKAQRRRRADADRSVQAIRQAALEALASDPDASMAEIARRAGVVRATIYAHFPTRESLLDAVMELAVDQVAQAMRAADPERGEPKQALERVLLATWQQLSQFHTVLAININRLSTKELHRRHLPMTTQLVPLIEREAQWQRIIGAYVNNRNCNVFQNPVDYIEYSLCQFAAKPARELRVRITHL